MHMFITLLFIALIAHDVNGLGLNNFLRMIKPGRTREPENKKPELFVPLKGRMVWEVTTAAPTTAPTTAKVTTAEKMMMMTKVESSSVEKSAIGLEITDCNKAYLPDFAAILSNSPFGQMVLEQLVQQMAGPTTEAPSDSTGPGLVYNTDCEEHFLPEFVAILSSSSFGQDVLSDLQRQGLVTFNEPQVLAG